MSPSVALKSGQKMKIHRNIYLKIRNYCRENKLIERGDRILVAVSGGPDSVFLLHFIIMVSKEIVFDYAVCHAEHGIRGEESIRDQEFVKNMCTSMGIRLYEGSIDVPANKRDDESLEEAARRLRYEFFKDIMRTEGFNKLATGHTYNDNTETILLRLLMGTGSVGFAGIKPKRDNIIRPLLCVRKEEILSCLEDGDYRIDRTNLEIDYLRNRLRLKVLPILREINPLYDEHLQRFAVIKNDEGEFIEEITEKYLNQILMEQSGDKTVVNLPDFLNLHIAIRRRILIRLIRNVYNGYPSYKLINMLVSVKPGGNKLLYSNKLFEVRKEYDKLIVDKRVVCENIEDYFYYLNRPGENGELIELKEIDKILKLNYLNSVERFDNDKLYIDAESVVFPLVIRNRREGDRIKLPGVGVKKLKDLFIDDKVPLKLRDKVPLVVDGSGKIIGILRTIYGKPNRTACDFMVKKCTRNVLVLELC